jgi:predicted acyltransferase
MPGRLYEGRWDPEGLLTTLPAIATTLLGVMTSQGLRSPVSQRAKSLGLLVSGTVFVLAGQLMNKRFPINKNLWTSSYVVFTGGIALLCLGVCTWVVDVKQYRRWAKPFMVLGMNAIAVYVLSDLGGQILDILELTQPDGTPVTLRTFLYERLFASWAGRLEGSLLFAVTYLLLWLGPMGLLYRKRIFIRV